MGLAPSLMHRRRVMDKLITYVGLDVHKDTIAIALAESGKRGEVREYGSSIFVAVLAPPGERDAGDRRAGIGPVNVHLHALFGQAVHLEHCGLDHALDEVAPALIALRGLRVAANG
jgi:hypothetical protein